MATKKAATAKKARAKSQPAKTTVTTVKAVEATKSPVTKSSGDRRTVLAAALIGEFIGTFLLTSAFLVSKGEPLYMGFALVGIILTVGTLSGAYLNPLLTVGAWVTRKLSHLRAVGYLVAQLLGAGAAFVALTTFIGAIGTTSTSSFSQAPELFHFNPLTDKNQWYVFGAELVAGAVLAFAFAGALIERTDRVAKALTVGLTLLVCAMVAGIAVSYLSASVAINPAIALAAKAVDFSAFTWGGAVVVYIAAPLIGGIIGFALRDVVETK